MKKGKLLNEKMLEKVTGGGMSKRNYDYVKNRIYDEIAFEDIEKAMAILNKYKDMEGGGGVLATRCIMEIYQSADIKQRKDTTNQGGASSGW